MTSVINKTMSSPQRSDCRKFTFAYGLLAIVFIIYYHFTESETGFYCSL